MKRDFFQWSAGRPPASCQPIWRAVGSEAPRPFDNCVRVAKTMWPLLRSAGAVQIETRGRAARAPSFCGRLIFVGQLLIFVTFRTSGQITNGLPKLAPPLPELPPTFWEQHSGVVLILAIVALVISAIVSVLALRPKAAVVVPPEVEARRALETLRSRAEDGAVLSRISQTLRRYFTAVFALPPGEYTTADFCRTVSAREEIGPELATKVSDFLRACDERKFSPAPPAASSNATARALELVGQAEARRTQLRQTASAQVATRPPGKP